MIYRRDGDALSLESGSFGGGRIVASQGSSTFYIPNYFITDHLGSVRAITDNDGNLLHTSDYYPFGLRWDDTRSLASDNRWLYNGKESQESLGMNYLDYGARMYDPRIGRWHSPDPLAEKYYSSTPYNYCANSPVMFIDPNGQEIWIYFEDEDKYTQQLLYTANMTYDGDNSFVSNVIDNLNAVYNSGGNKMLDLLISSSNRFNILNRNNSNKEAAGAFRRNMKGGGEIDAARIGEELTFANVEIMAHELFHAIQHEYGQGGASVFNEVEAMVYGYSIATNWGIKNDIAGGSMTPMGKDSDEGRAYEKAFSNLQWNGYSQAVMVDAIKYFKSGAYVNGTGLYSNIPFLPKRYNGGKLKSILGGIHPNSKK